jgi:hypothetical protein
VDLIQSAPGDETPEVERDRARTLGTAVAKANSKFARWRSH